MLDTSPEIFCASPHIFDVSPVSFSAFTRVFWILFSGFWVISAPSLCCLLVPALFVPHQNAVVKRVVNYPIAKAGVSTTKEN